MRVKNFLIFNRLVAWFSLAVALAFSWPAPAAPTIVSTMPASGATGVSTTTTVVFTFSEAMDVDATDVIFYDAAFHTYMPTPAWSAGNTVLTCTPVSPYPSNTLINWAVSGQNPDGDPLAGFPIGAFTTSTGGGGDGGGGSGTNAITTFDLSKTHFYHQTSPALPVLDSDTPYLFSASTDLSSNRTALSVQLTLPTGSVSNLTHSFSEPEFFALFAFNTNLTALDATFPSGNYSFNVQAMTSNQMVTVNFPAGLSQPVAPHISNYAAAQTVNPTAPFKLTWDAFPGGSAADFIAVSIGDVFDSPDFGSPGALSGTATSLTIPAGTLEPGMEYDSTIIFYHYVVITNGSSYIRAVVRGTFTDFTLTTANGNVTAPLILTNAVYAPANFSFDVLCSPGQTVTVEYKANLMPGPWLTLLTTNSPGNSFRVVAPQAASNRSLFFRAKNGM